MTTRHDFQDDLDLLETRVELLFAEVEHAVDRSVAALENGDENLARETIAHDDLIDEITVSIEEAVILMIARQAPVASDLRYLLSVLRISSDLERSGDLALRVAKQALLPVWLDRAQAIRPMIGRLGQCALEALRAAGKAWHDRDEGAWEDIESLDTQVDTQYASLLDELRQLEGPQMGDVAVHALIAGQAIERIADHAVAIAQRVRFLVTGKPEGLAGEIGP